MSISNRSLATLLIAQVLILLGLLNQTNPKTFDIDPDIFAPEVTARFTGTVHRVVDGDSLYIKGVEPQIRLWGVDAPEVGEAGDNAARSHLTELTYLKSVTCDQVDTDRYGRIVARCYTDAQIKVNRALIESGVASEFTRYSGGYYARTKAQ